MPRLIFKPGTKYNYPENKTMTYAEQLYAYMKMVTDAGYHLPIQDKDGDICIFSLMKDKEGDNRRSGWWNSSLEEAKQFLGGWPGYTKKEFLEKATKQNWKPLDPFMLETKPLPVGTKVKVKGEEGDWEIEHNIITTGEHHIRPTIITTLDNGWRGLNVRPDQITTIFSPELPPTYPMSEDEMIELKPGLINNMPNFKVGDRVRRKKGSGSCSGADEGEVYVVEKRDGYLLLGGTYCGKGITCHQYWELVEKTLETPEKTLETLEVGDWVKEKSYFRYVLAVLHRNSERTVYILSGFCGAPDLNNNQSKESRSSNTAFELKESGWEPYNPSPLTEITAEDAINEIAKQRGVDPESIRIKK